MKRDLSALPCDSSAFNPVQLVLEQPELLGIPLAFGLAPEFLLGQPLHLALEHFHFRLMALPARLEELGFACAVTT